MVDGIVNLSFYILGILNAEHFVNTVAFAYVRELRDGVEEVAGDFARGAHGVGVDLPVVAFGAG